jgi:hypothetical protein
MCPAGWLCVDSFCRQGTQCLASNDCQAPLVCKGGQCVTGP